MNELYYTPPPQKNFDELKEKAIELWKEIGKRPDYIKEKIERIKSLENIKDNFMFIVAIFSSNNQYKLANKLSDETKKIIYERAKEAGDIFIMMPFSDEEFN